MSVALGVGILFADQWIKKIIQLRWANRSFGWGAPVRIHFAAHRDPSYERTGTRAALVVTWVLALVFGIILCRFGLAFQSSTSRAGLGLAFGGAASNLWDILRRGYVIDFIDLGWWPVFNVADVAIVAGLGAAFFG